MALERSRAVEEALRAAIGEVIRTVRLERGLSQEQVGDLHRNYIGGVERGTINPTVTQLVRVASGLGMSGSDLLRLIELRAAELSGSRRG
jgi:transcriptional regulator with XRE-family HTH domain